MYDANLGCLKKTEVRKKWPNEAKDFTPWLVKHLGWLSSAIGIDFDFVEKERKAGPFSADIYARDIRGGHGVVIENQLEKADLQHMGQLITYVAQLEAGHGVWVATGFRSTILKAVRRLNKHWPDNTGFFAVKIGLYESQDGVFQPTLELVEHPKWWIDPVAQRFWAYFERRQPGSPKASFDQISSRRRRRFVVDGTNLRLTQYFRGDCVRVYLTGNSGDTDEDVFSRIRPYRKTLFDEIEKSEFLAGDNPRCTTEFRVNSHNECNWDTMIDWLNNQRDKYESVLRKCYHPGH